MSNDIDFDLNNYSLNDLLNLFHLPYDFSKEQLRNSKRIVLKTHPDKSNLPKEYFLFFSKAYKMIYKIYEYRYKNENQSTEYSVDKDKEQEEILSKIKNKKNFNQWFNDMFENHKIENEHDKGGYGEWFQSGDNIDDRKITQGEMGKVFEEKKREMKEIVVHNGIQDITNNSGLTDLTGEQPSYYQSDLFSSLQYDDLKKAHTETVVPVTEQDYNEKQKFNNINELREHRQQQNIAPPSQQQSQEFFQQQKMNTDQSDVERAYKLLKQDEIVKQINEKWWGKVKQITNNN